MSRRNVLWLCLALFAGPGLTSDAEASVVSRLGDIYLYDPLTFDAGSIQRGVSVRGDARADMGALDASVDLPFFRDFALQLGYVERIFPGEPDGFDLRWRFRIPILESARFAHFSSSQVYLSGSHQFGAIDAQIPTFAAGLAQSMTLPIASFYTSIHAQLGTIVRSASQIPAETDGGRVGLSLHAAYIVLLYHPARGPGGQWTVSLSLAEYSAYHYAPFRRDGQDGSMSLTAAAPALHFSPRRATYTLGLAPKLIWAYTPDGWSLNLAGMANFSVSYRGALE